VSDISSVVKLSIIIPVYNTEQHLKSCLDSLLGSVTEDIEIILVDDGSTDGSPAICGDYRERYKQIRVIRQDNGGLAAARNTGLDAAEGEYVTFIDSDDTTETDYLEQALGYLGEGLDIIAFSYFIDYTQTDSSRVRKIPSLDGVSPAEAVRALETSGALNMVWNKIYRRELLIKAPATAFQINSEPGEDLLFNCGCFPKASLVTLVSQPYYHWIRRGEDTLANRYRKDLYEKNKRFIEARCGLYRDLSMEESDLPLLSKGNLAYIFTCIPNMYREGNRMPRRERIDFYREILGSEDVRTWVRVTAPVGTLHSQFIRLYRTGSAAVMDAYYSSAIWARGRFDTLWQKTRKRIKT